MQIYKITTALFLIFVILNILVESRLVISEDDLDNLEDAVDREMEDAVEVMHEIRNIREKLRGHRRDDDELSVPYLRRRRGHNQTIIQYRLCLAARRNRQPMSEQCANLFGKNNESDNTRIFHTSRS